ncbi:RagB/SusD family nutrient uptake outer membrane protein [Lewinella sp. IMCC34183]|uniref:RagB/SusD family nutrient uptake outer membrane protein n=1 Tax=Lewinella sp. IMCC34183 TaxID=2248762 RepID=UPI000E22A3D3|nr:RagB/SusD family nutrient uptake outer membrane protein [Lewinella sp. IMCC34183]
MNFNIKSRVLGIAMAVALVLPFNSCTDLDPELFSDLSNDNFPAGQGDVIGLYLSAYTRLFPMMNHNSYMSIQEVSSDEVAIPQRGSDWFDGGIWLRTHQLTFDATDQQFNNAWVFLYQGVQQTNLVIQTIQETDAITDEDKALYLSEIRSLRAYWYMLLMDAFGSVPLITEDSDLTDLSPVQASRAEIFNFVETELLDAASGLLEEKSINTYGKINYWVNRALLSRLYLNAEVYTGTPRYAEAEQMADEVINSGLYSLTDDYFDNFSVDNDNGFNSTSENMWVIPYDAPAVAGGFNIPMQTLHYVSQTTFSLQEQPWNGYCSLSEFYNSYDDDDLRKGEYGSYTRGNFLAGPQYAANGEDILEDGVATDPDGPGVVHTPELNALFPNAYRQAGVRIYKYEIPNGSPSTIPNDFPIVRYAEVLLNKAEAQMRQGDDGGAMLVNMIRNRAGLEDMDDVDMEEMLAERGREFFYEGLRRTDLIRFGAFASGTWPFKSPQPETANLFPIPAPQLNANSNLQQNQGY